MFEWNQDDLVKQLVLVPIYQKHYQKMDSRQTKDTLSKSYPVLRNRPRNPKTKRRKWLISMNLPYCMHIFPSIDFQMLEILWSQQTKFSCSRSWCFRKKSHLYRDIRVSVIRRLVIISCLQYDLSRRVK